MVVSLFRSEMLGFNMSANFCSKFLCKCFDVFGGAIHDSDQKRIFSFNQNFQAKLFGFGETSLVQQTIT